MDRPALHHIVLAFSLSAVLLQAYHATATSPNKDPSSVNLSSLTWATVKDTQALERHSALREQNLSVMVEDTIDNVESGGFDSLDGMLQWAIGHSAPEKLKGAAEEVQNLTASELEKRQLQIKELMEKLKMPSDADLMKTAIEDLENLSLSVEYRHRALQELLDLVEPVDNANDLNKLGGLKVVIKELYRPEDELRISAAWILGKASQNNGLVQNQLLQLGALPRLMEMIQSDCVEEAVKALYAVSAIIRNHPFGQEAFFTHGGASLLEDVMKNASSDVRLRRKSLFLIADMAELAKESGAIPSKFQPSKSFLMSIVNVVVVPDLDTQEKALMAIRSLGYSSSTTHDMLKKDCSVEAALENLCVQLNKLMQADEELDFVRDLHALCQSVRSMFLEGEETRTISNSISHDQGGILQLANVR